VGTERSGIYRLLRFSFVYDFIQRAIGSNKALDFLVSEHIRAFPGAAVLDIGAGTGSISHHLGPISYLGIEPNARYVSDFNSQSKSERVRLVQGTTDSVTVEPESFDIVTILAVLHHVPDSHARQILGFAERAIRPNGRIVLLDPVLHAGQHVVSRFLAERDRGRYVRDRASYEALFSSTSLHTTFEIRTDLMKIPYSHILVQATK
jgi:2-polyprenyl-3-methyl-5-hydroxy-6-metoxy-1,4-benzoquinol methylase